MIPAKSEVVDYFRSLGYEVDWDFNRRKQNYWYEIRNSQGMIQIDVHASLASIKEDLPLLAQDLPGTSTGPGSDWELRCEDDQFLRDVAARMIWGFGYPTDT